MPLIKINWDPTHKAIIPNFLSRKKSCHLVLSQISFLKQEAKWLNADVYLLKVLCKISAQRRSGNDLGIDLHYTGPCHVVFQIHTRWYTGRFEEIKVPDLHSKWDKYIIWMFLLDDSNNQISTLLSSVRLGRSKGSIQTCIDLVVFLPSALGIDSIVNTPVDLSGTKDNLPRFWVQREYLLHFSEQNYLINFRGIFLTHEINQTYWILSKTLLSFSLHYHMVRLCV